MYENSPISCQEREWQENEEVNKAFQVPDAQAWCNLTEQSAAHEDFQK